MAHRLISLTALVALAAATVAAAQPDSRSLFNGKDLTGWDGDPKFWSVQDGALTGTTTPDRPTPQNTFLIWKGGTLKDFDLRVKFRIEGGNSGIQYRSKHLGNWVVAGYQADFEAGDRWNGLIYEERGRGVLAEPGQRTVIGEDGKPKVVGTVGDPEKIKAAVRKGEWNEYHLVARGNQLRHEINGVVTAETTDEDTDGRAAEGILALQLHQGPPMKVQFKDFHLKQL
ncbi:MAG: DUF1080 domain-containing protein [Armatimonadota bacterium]